MDGRYAATASWHEKTGYKLTFWGQNNDPAKIKMSAARAYYTPLDKSTGWASMEVQTNEHYDDEVQATAAGMLEGSLSWQLIYFHWQNTVGTTCKKRANACEKIKGILESNYNKVKQSAVRYKNENSFWYQVNLIYAQLEGLHEGWKTGKDRSLGKMIHELTFTDFLWMNHADDVRDIEMMLDITSNHSAYFIKPPADLAVLKYLPTSDSQFLIAHQRSGLYTEMLRMMKRYTFGFHDMPGKSSNLVPGQQISFTSYPGAVLSQDDFYQIKGGSRLQIVSSRIRVHSPKTWKHFHDLTVFSGARAMVANRLSVNSGSWASFFSKYNSGTGNKAWLVMDHRAPDPNLWLVEQVPAFTNKTDITDSWKQKGYWISCGIPDSEKALRFSGLEDPTSGKRDMDYMTSIRDILESGIVEVTNTDTMHALVANPSLVAKVRGDIVGNGMAASNAANPTSTTPSSPTDNVGIFRKQPLQGKFLDKKQKIVSATQDPELPAYNGVIDTKLAYDISDFKAVAGPLYTLNEATIAPFQWSKASPPKGIYHIGQPDVWDFPPVHPNFVW
ncbi:hypothetical protein GE061_001786 [Apolygus lucorum]|uniref:Phospholipase B-like n=1 Tax=Apolygus lucorum TaxID=248454 RepID=A0A8S9X790_APOLU|nr:hypothetical protein GE061_001786 [Apolygus lucorum]